ncbi:hypothetical protein OOK31_14515 [Streptomyces sp. NBC_00249]|uniref:hypothetical protein n=1 Tax=Streptomyces sp. NBC_00249 TaxID=2975690 RepID=UPI002256ACE0|nr:hypothetical protein [Streptomyces sp. NBC_00249]MCX5195099.1 hypothetical protein [Streptomyces sp. NBC_00249]
MSVIDPAVSVRLSAAGARRLAGMLAEAAHLLEDAGPQRLTDEQAGVLGQGADRPELAGWARGLAAELRAQL